MSGWWNRVYLGSCERMAAIPDASVHCCVTSPPYFGLRDYGVEGQIGLEETVGAYVERLVGVFREVRRVLRDDATAWLNLGDSYAGSWGAQGRDGAISSRSVVSVRQIAAHPHRKSQTGSIRDEGLKPKDLIGVPWRVAFALQADGWWLRDEIIWHKPVCMPSSVRDRTTRNHEQIFMLTKSPRYYYDQDAIRTPLKESSVERLTQPAYEEQEGSLRANAGGKTNGPMKAVYTPGRRDVESGTAQVTNANRVWSDAEARNRLVAQGANRRSVWTISYEPYNDAHFATFPSEIPSLCIRAGSPVGGVVLDPFMGSGTTAEVAEALGRRWVGYELNPEYHRLINERTRQAGLFSDGGVA